MMDGKWHVTVKYVTYIGNEVACEQVAETDATVTHGSGEMHTLYTTTCLDVHLQ